MNNEKLRYKTYLSLVSFLGRRFSIQRQIERCFRRAGFCSCRGLDQTQSLRTITVHRSGTNSNDFDGNTTVLIYIVIR